MPARSTPGKSRAETPDASGIPASQLSRLRSSSGLTRTCVQLLNCVQGVLGFCYDLRGQRNITQVVCELLPVRQAIGDEFFQGVKLRLVVACFVQEQPGKSSDRIVVFSVRVLRPAAQEPRCKLSRGKSSRPAFRCRFDELPRLVLEFGECQLVIDRIAILDVANCSRSLLNQSGHAVIALAGDSGRPGHSRSLSHLILEFGADG